MTEDIRRDLIAYKMDAARNLIVEVKSHIENGFYNTAMNRMYYACFCAASALLIAEKVPESKRHATVRNLFNLHFVKTGRFAPEWGVFYSNIMNCREAADYEDFKIYTKKETEERFLPTRKFVELVEKELKEQYFID